MAQEVFKLCKMFSLVLALALAVTGIYTVWSFSAYDETSFTLVNTTLQPAMKYYDANTLGGTNKPI